MTGRQKSVVTESQTGKMAGRNKGRQDSNRTTSARKKDRQARQLQTKLVVGTVIERWEQTTDWQKDRQTVQLTGRQTSVVTESQTTKMAGRNKGRQGSNRQTSARKKDRQARQLQTILGGGTVIERWEQTTDWQYDRQINRQTDEQAECQKVFGLNRN